MTKDNLISRENLVQILTLAYTKGNNVSDITPKEMIQEMSNKLELIMREI